MASKDHPSEYYRQRASKLRELAHKTIDPGICADWREKARHLDAMAEAAEMGERTGKSH